MPEGQEVPIDELSQVAASKEAPRTTLAERHPDWPPIKVKFYFSPHITAEDMAGMKKHMSDVNIYLYESAGGNGFTQFYQEVANAPGSNLYGDNVEQVMKNTRINDRPLDNTHYESIIRSLYESKVIVGHIDLRDSEAGLNQEIRDEFERRDYDDDFDKTLSNLKENYRKIGQLQNAREQVMLIRFEEELEEIVAAHPELKDKPDLNILVTLGSNHTTLFHKFLKEGISAERVFSAQPYIYSYIDQIQRNFMFGKEPSQETMARGYLEKYFRIGLGMAIADGVSSSDLESIYLRQVSSCYSVEDIKKMHNQYKGYITIERLNELLGSKGLEPLPRTNEELQQFVTKQKNKAEKISQG